MDEIPDEGSFQIVLQSDGIDNLSEYWQDQCKYLYDEISIALPEGSIKPLTLEGTAGEKAIDIVLFSHLIVNEIAAKFVASLFIEIVFESSRKWSNHRRNSNIKVKYPDESVVTISKQFIFKLRNYSKENPQLSIFKVLNHFKNFQE
jgi:hypothetical protein